MQQPPVFFFRLAIFSAGFIAMIADNMRLKMRGVAG